MYSTELNAKPPMAVRFAGGRVQERVPLEPGNDGFLTAEFADGTQKHFELPNLVLEVALRPAGWKKKKKKCKKRPCAAGVAEATECKKRPAAVAAKKKPAGFEEADNAMESESATSGGEEASEPPPARPAAALPAQEVSTWYGIMYYKSHNAIGIRAKFGKKNQVLSFGSGSNKDKDALKAIGKKVVDLLDGGMGVAAAKKEGDRLANLQVE